MTAPPGYDINTNPIKSDFHKMRDHTIIFANAMNVRSKSTVSNLLIGMGPNGIGKSETMGQFLEEVGLDFEEIRPNGNNFAEVIYKNNHPSLVLLLDDTNNILRSPPCLEVLRLATQTKNRIIPGETYSLRGASRDSDGNLIPFQVHCRFVLLTNLALYRMAGQESEKGSLLRGILDRAGFNKKSIGVKATNLQIYNYACYVTTEMARPYLTNVDPDHINDVLRFFATYRQHVRHPNSRTMDEFILARASSPDYEFFKRLAIDDDFMRPIPPTWVEPTAAQIRPFLWYYEREEEWYARTGIHTGDLPKKPAPFSQKLAANALKPSSQLRAKLQAVMHARNAHWGIPGTAPTVKPKVEETPQYDNVTMAKILENGPNYSKDDVVEVLGVSGDKTSVKTDEGVEFEIKSDRIEII